MLKTNYGRVRYYESIMMKAFDLIRESETYERDRNRALDEDFVFGYYAQKKELYSSKNKKQENQEEEDNENGSITEKD